MPRSRLNDTPSYAVARQLQRSYPTAWPDQEMRQSARSFRNFAAGLEQLEVERKSRFMRFLLDATLILLGWALFIGLVAYPQAQLVGLIACAIAMLFVRK